MGIEGRALLRDRQARIRHEHRMRRYDPGGIGPHQPASSVVQWALFPQNRSFISPCAISPPIKRQFEFVQIDKAAAKFIRGGFRPRSCEEDAAFRPWQAWQRPTLPNLEV